MTNGQYTIAIDNKAVSKDTIQKIKATDFAIYSILETFINGSNPSENKYQISLITNKYYSTRKSSPERLYWENYTAKVSTNNSTHQATQDEVDWMEKFSKKYNLFSPTTSTTINGITEAEQKKQWKFLIKCQ